jgi:hypothetical protein
VCNAASAPPGCSTEGQCLSVGSALYGSRSILPAWQESPSQLSRQAGISADHQRNPLPGRAAQPCQFAPGDAPAAGLVTTSAAWCGLIAGPRIQAVRVEAGLLGLASSSAPVPRLGAAPIRGRVYECRAAGVRLRSAMPAVSAQQPRLAQAGQADGQAALAAPAGGRRAGAATPESVMNCTIVGFLGLVAGVPSVPAPDHVVQDMRLGGFVLTSLVWRYAAGRSLTEL